MPLKTVLNMYITAFIVLLFVSSFFLIKDLRGGEFIQDKLHFFTASTFHGKKSCNKVKTEDCVPDFLSMILGTDQNAETPETNKAVLIEEEPSQTPPSQPTPPPNARF